MIIGSQLLQCRFRGCKDAAKQKCGCELLNSLADLCSVQAGLPCASISDVVPPWRITDFSSRILPPRASPSGLPGSGARPVASGSA